MYSYQNIQWPPGANSVFSMQMSGEPQLECSSRELSEVCCHGLEMSVSVNKSFNHMSKAENKNVCGYQEGQQSSHPLQQFPMLFTSQLSTVVNVVWPTTIRSLSHWAATFVDKIKGVKQHITKVLWELRLVPPVTLNSDLWPWPLNLI